MPYKIRAQKKKESAEIRLVNRSEELIDQARTHMGWIWGAVATLLLALSIFVVLWFLNQRVNGKAAELEAEAGVLFHEPPPPPQPKEEGKEAPKELTKTERIQKAATLYQDILKKYPRTASAPVAQYEIGNVYFELKDYPAAEKEYQAFLEKYSGNKELGSFIHLKLGYLYQAKGDDAAALKQLRLAYDKPDPRGKDQAGFEVGRLLEKMDNKKEATEVYKKVSEDFSQSPWASEAKGRLALLDPSSVPPPVAQQGPPVSGPGQMVIPITPKSGPPPVAPPKKGAEPKQAPLPAKK